MASKKSNKVYNVNEMRQVILAAREEGNRKVITLGFCKQHGVTEGFFKEYNGRMQELLIAVQNYIRVKHANSVEIAELGGEEEWAKSCHDAREAIFPAWKNMLECGEKDKFAKKLHVNPNDIDSLVGYGEMFMAMNNEDKFAKKQIACSQAAAFRKKVETLIGIRVDDVDVMADDERDFLLKERKLTASIASTESAMKRYSDELTQLEPLKNVLINSEQLSKLDEVITEKQEKIANCKKNIADKTAQLTELRGNRKKELKEQARKAVA